MRILERRKSPRAQQHHHTLHRYFNPEKSIASGRAAGREIERGICCIPKAKAMCIHVADTIDGMHNRSLQSSGCTLYPPCSAAFVRRPARFHRTDIRARSMCIHAHAALSLFRNPPADSDGEKDGKPCAKLCRRANAAPCT